MLDLVGRDPLDGSVRDDIAQFEALYPFALDEFQREAIRTLLSGDSVMVAAPTGTGKTVVAEFGVWEAFKRTGRVIYTTPIKALSNQKYRDLRAIYGDEVGLLTGDVSENRDARVVVMTTEVLRNMLLQTPWDLDDVDSVIFDEIHYLADPERGTTWEESIILCPEHVQLICLSATVTNADEIAAWISRTHRPIRLITHTERAVPLALYYFIDGKLNLVVDHTGAQVRDFPHTGGELRRQAARGGFAKRRAERSTPEMDEPQPREIVDALAAQDMLPAIYFLFSRNDCQAFAERLAVMRPNLVTERQVGLIDQTIEAILAGMRPEDRELEQVQTIDRPRPQGHRLPPRRPAADPQAARRSALHARADAGRLRHRHAGARRQHAGPHGRHRPHEQVGRPPPPHADPERVPADGRPGRPPRHGPIRPRRRPLLAVVHLPRDAGHRHRRAAAGAVRLRDPLQHRAQPLGSAARRARPRTCCSRAWPSSRPASASASWKTRSSRSAKRSTAFRRAA